MSCTGILLAAGCSSRMGRLKALLPWEGKTILEHQLMEMNKSCIDESIVVLGWQAPILLSYIEEGSARVVLNLEYEKGKTESIKAGLKEVNDQASSLVLINIDQPVHHEVLNKMIEHFHSTDRKIVIPTYKGKRGHPILFSASLLEEISQIKEETFGLKDIIHRRHDLISELELNEPSILFNFNTMDDYREGEGR